MPGLVDPGSSGSSCSSSGSSSGSCSGSCMRVLCVLPMLFFICPYSYARFRRQGGPLSCRTAFCTGRFFLCVIMCSCSVRVLKFASPVSCEASRELLRGTAPHTKLVLFVGFSFPGAVEVPRSLRSVIGKDRTATQHLEMRRHGTPCVGIFSCLFRFFCPGVRFLPPSRSLCIHVSKISHPSCLASCYPLSRWLVCAGRA